MITRIKNHFFPYLILFSLLSLGAISFLLSAGNKHSQFKIVVLTSFFYVVWGMIHHFLDKTLYLKIVIEYIAVAMLAIVVLGGLLL
ncbi:hypothetical protein ISS85_02635 [Candidatus Microgenomates bacterium]|nr:hypothetical protein [Candidatus Microgenomates bacterium]